MSFIILFIIIFFGPWLKKKRRVKHWAILRHDQKVISIVLFISIVQLRPLLPFFFSSSVNIFQREHRLYKPEACGILIHFLCILISYE